MNDFLAWISPLLEPNFLYLILIGSAWVGIVAVFVPGTGIIEATAVVGLLFGLGGLIYRGASIGGFALLVLSFGLYGYAVLRSIQAVQSPEALPPMQRQLSLLLGVIAALLQAFGGLLLFSNAIDVSPWTVLALALVSLAIYRWMLVPAIMSLRPPPQTGSESLIGSRAVVRQAQADAGKTAMIYFNGELWQAVADEPLAEGDEIEVVGRDGMRLRVQKVS